MSKFKLVVFLASLVPASALLYEALTDKLGVNPVETLEHETGSWALRFLLLTLAMTPLRKITGRNEFVRIRRMLGLFTFFYATVHLFAYVLFDHFFDWLAIWEDIYKRPYVTVGFAAWLLMSLLAITSNAWSQRRLKQRWKALHKTVYLVGIFAILHFWWLVKADIREPAVYGLILAVLLFMRTKYLDKTAGWIRSRC